VVPALAFFLASVEGLDRKFQSVYTPLRYLVSDDEENFVTPNCT
jgi:hypothetical protein